MDIRMLQSGELKEAARLADRTFRDESQPSMAVSFPYIFSEAVQPFSFGAFDQGKLVSFFGFVPWTVRVGEARLRAFFVGSVCTDPAYRGQGIASRILERIVAFADEAGASLIFVSGSRSLYVRAHCYPFGRFRRYRLDGETAARLKRQPDADGYAVREAGPADLFAIHALSAARTVRFEADVNGLGALLKAQAVPSIMKGEQRVYVAEAGKEVRAFAVVAAGAERTAVLEWAGDPAATAVLAADCALGIGGGAALELAVPGADLELRRRLEDAGAEAREENNEGTVRIVRLERLLEQLRPWLGERTLPAEGLTPEQLTALCFDRAAGGHDCPERTNWEPVPLPYTGGLYFI
ncbi:GNAT family N-acetyltransferase [Paenibacillus thermoaerophilus]|uniref:GNAT family N-acetyltransferase n=1 Tax=Paenibacillus thermoaerophilus TaxID=1215385 RepID=A0ABW2V5C2_9BACL|nr:GNAT family N-acetyltransferase [Paenibacillus thermoaerophilus]TMV11153.1 GNAT family N-acetyltransferase [Paenibacillus thermoaerophilus]